MRHCIGRLGMAPWLVAALSLLNGCAPMSTQQPMRQQVPLVPEHPEFHGHPWPLDTSGHKLQGTTLVMALVDATGSVTEACINRTSDHVELDQLAVQWLAEQHLRPASRNGVAVSGYVRMPIEFTTLPPELRTPPGYPKAYCQTRPVAELLETLTR